MTMAEPEQSDPEMVDYDYFAAGLNVRLGTIQIYAKANDPALRVDSFPKPHLTIGGVPYFLRSDADEFISRRQATARLSSQRKNTPAVTAPKIYTKSELTDPDLVDYPYFAEKLGVKLTTVRIYATSSSPTNKAANFPEPVSYRRARGGHLSPLFQKAAADAFIQERRSKTLLAPTHTITGGSGMNEKHDIDRSELDDSLTWLKRVGGIDDEWIDRWPKAAWAQWDKARKTPSSQPNPAVPEWMRDIVGTHWYGDFSFPLPTVAQLLPSAHDWFKEADNRPEFTLYVEEPLNEEIPTPTLEQLRQAWNLATKMGAIPLLHVNMLPTEPWGEGITGGIEGFYVVGARKLPALLRTPTAQILGSPGSSDSHMTATPTKLLEEAGLRPIPGAGMLAWEWL